MSDSRDDAVKSATMDPTSASEKYYRRKLIESQIAASKSKDAQVKAILGNMSEEEQIRNDVLLKITQYKPSTPQWYMLVAMCKGRTDPFDQAEYLAHEMYENQKTEVAMSYFTPSKTSVREGFIKSARAGVSEMESNLDAVETRIAAKKGVLTGMVSSAAGGRRASASASGSG